MRAALRVFAGRPARRLTTRALLVLTTLAVASAAGTSVAATDAHRPLPAAGNSCTARIALTFDDGPSFYRPETLRMLRDMHVPATFFDVGMRVTANPQLTAFEAREGHTVLNHTYTHPNLTSVSDVQIQMQVLATEAAFAAAGASIPYRVVRPPFGAADDRVRGALAAVGYTAVTWDVSAPTDYIPTTTAAQIRDDILAGLRPGAVVLMHDGNVDTAAGAATVEALPGIIDTARERGFCFGRVDGAGQVVAARLRPSREPVPATVNPVPYLPLAVPGDPPEPYVIVRP